MLGVGNHNFFASVNRVQCNGVIRKSRKANHTFVAYDLNTVFFGRLMSYKTPRTGTYETGIKLEAGTQRIFRRV